MTITITAKELIVVYLFLHIVIGLYVFYSNLIKCWAWNKMGEADRINIIEKMILLNEHTVEKNSYNKKWIKVNEMDDFWPRYDTYSYKNIYQLNILTFFIICILFKFPQYLFKFCLNIIYLLIAFEPMKMKRQLSGAPDPWLIRMN